MGYTFGEKKIIYVKNVTVLGDLTVPTVRYVLVGKVPVPTCS